MRPRTIRPPCSRNWSTPIGDACKSALHQITIPNGVSYEVFQTAAHPGWDSRNETICKAFAQTWHDDKRSALLIVPAIPARIERNFLTNPVSCQGHHAHCPSRYGGMTGSMGGFEEGSPWRDMCLAYFQHPGAWGQERRSPSAGALRQICIIV